MYEQNFHAPVGTVVNVDYSELAALAPQGSRLTERAWLAATLVDRQPQFEAIDGRIDAIVSKNGGGKLLIVLRGIRPDIHQGLVLRCALAHFGEHYGAQNGGAYIGRLPWPRGAESIQSVLRKLANALAFPKSAQAQAAIEEGLAKLPKSVCFSHHLHADWWSEREQRLVLDWADYMCHGWPSPSAGRLVVGFLCLDSGSGTQDPFDGLVAELHRRAGTDEHGPILLTEPLDLIAASDVEDWASEVGRFLNLPSVEALLLNSANELFAPTFQRLRFAEVYKGLCTKLAAVFPAGPHFTTTDR